MTTLSIVRAFLKERLDIDPERVIPAASLADLGVDSLMLLELLFEFEERLGVDLAKDMATPKTVGELLKIVEGMQEHQAAN